MDYCKLLCRGNYVIFLFRDSNWDTWSIKGSIKVCSESLHYHSINTVTDKSVGTSGLIFRLSKWDFPYGQQCRLFAGTVSLRKIFGIMSLSSLLYSCFHCNSITYRLWLVLAASFLSCSWCLPALDQCSKGQFWQCYFCEHQACVYYRMKLHPL